MLFAAVPAFAISTACAAINADWQNVQTDKNSTYPKSSFDGDERISFTLTDPSPSGVRGMVGSFRMTRDGGGFASSILVSYGSTSFANSKAYGFGSAATVVDVANLDAYGLGLDLYNTAGAMVKVSVRCQPAPVSSEARLSNLTVDGIALTPAFSSNHTQYSATVEHSVESVVITPTTLHNRATAAVGQQVLASGTPSSPVALNPVKTVIMVNGTAQDGFTGSFYEITITRKPRPLDLAPASGALPGATIGSAYSQGLSSTGQGPITYSLLSGMLPTGIDLVQTGELAGSANSGTEGDYNFTIGATDHTGNTGKAQYTLKVSPKLRVLEIMPGSGALPVANAGQAYSQQLSSTGDGALVYSLLGGTLPAGLTLNSATGELAGPLNQGTESDYNFTIGVTDQAGNTGKAQYTLRVTQNVRVLELTPSSGALPTAMAGEDYSQRISSLSDSTLIYSIGAGTLPGGMELNISTGELTGPLAEAAEGDYSFTIGVRDQNGNTGKAQYTLNVAKREVTARNREVTVPAGATPANVDLTAGATGGPFDSAEVAFVEPPNAGTARIVMGEFAAAGPVATPTSFYLKFTPNPAYSGKVSVTYRLSSPIGVAGGVVTYSFGYDPNTVAGQIKQSVSGFVQTRQGLVTSTIAVPGLLERRAAANSSEGLTTAVSPSSDGLLLNFATSLIQNEAANQAAGLVEASPKAASAFNAWIEGTVSVHNRPANGNRWGSFAMLSLGADYLISEDFLAGVSAHLDRMVDPTNADAELTGTGWLAGPYASVEVIDGVFWDTSLRYGGSNNSIDTAFFDGSFDTTRWMFDTSLSGQWLIGEMTRLTPVLRAVYFSEQVQQYQVTNAVGDAIVMGGFTSEQLRLSAGLTLEHDIVFEGGLILTPRIGVTAGASALDGAAAFGALNAGLTLSAGTDWSINADALLNINGNEQYSVGAKLGLFGQF